MKNKFLLIFFCFIVSSISAIAAKNVVNVGDRTLTLNRLDNGTPLEIAPSDNALVDDATGDFLLNFKLFHSDNGTLKIGFEEYNP